MLNLSVLASLSAEFGLDFTGKDSRVYSFAHYLNKVARSPHCKNLQKNCLQELTNVSFMQHDGKSQR
jgi:hypothetical protein